MADFKRRSFILTSGKQIKLFGTSMAIGKTLEVGEGYAPNILSSVESNPDGKTITVIANPHKLTMDELMELADYNIRLWIDLKDNIRKYGIESSKIFARE